MRPATWPCFCGLRALLSPDNWQTHPSMPLAVLALQRVDLEDAPDTGKQPPDCGQAVASAPLTPAQRSKTLQALPPDVAAAAQAALDSLANADAQVWLLLHSCMGRQTCCCRPVMQS